MHGMVRPGAACMQDTRLAPRPVQPGGEARGEAVQRCVVAATRAEEQPARRHQGRREPGHALVGAQAGVRVLARFREGRWIADDDVETASPR